MGGDFEGGGLHDFWNWSASVVTSHLAHFGLFILALHAMLLCLCVVRYILRLYLDIVKKRQEILENERLFSFLCL